jgi:replication fork clamp-binding protein CrfC
MNPGRHDGKPGTNHLSYETAYKLWSSYQQSYRQVLLVMAEIGCCLLEVRRSNVQQINKEVSWEIAYSFFSRKVQ